MPKWALKATAMFAAVGKVEEHDPGPELPREQEPAPELGALADQLDAGKAVDGGPGAVAVALVVQDDEERDRCRPIRGRIPARDRPGVVIRVRVRHAFLLIPRKAPYLSSRTRRVP